MYSAAMTATAPTPASALEEVDRALGPILPLAAVGLIVGQAARDQIASLPLKERRAVLGVLRAMRSAPVATATANGVVHLFSAPYGEINRLRAGRARILVAVDEEEGTVTVQGVGLRPD